MKNLNQERNVLDLEFNTLQVRTNGSVSLINLIDEKTSVFTSMMYLTALMLSLPTITALLLMWFNVK